MPWRPSVSTSSTVRPSAARGRARAAATVVLPVPPLPVTTWQRTGWGSGLTPPSLGGPRSPHPSQVRVNLGTGPAGGPLRGGRSSTPPGALASCDMSEPVRRKWEYATIPLLIHNTKAILDSWGVDGWELVTVLPGPGGAEQPVAYLKRPVG